jgi:hypothetical protein
MENPCKNAWDLFWRIVMNRILIYSLYLVVSFSILACSSSPTPSSFDSFQDNQAYHAKFIGIWTENTSESGTYEVFEFRNDGTGFWTHYADNKISGAASLRYKTSEFQVFFHFNDTGNNNRANYTFTDNNLLSLVAFQSGRSNTSFHKSESIQTENNDIANTLIKAVDVILRPLAKDSRIAIINISSNDNQISEFVVGELEYFLVNNEFIVVDRGQLDKIRQEQNFQLSGEVDDNSAVSIGKFTGANIVIIGTISGSGNMRRLRLRALDTQTARVVGVASEAF